MHILGTHFAVLLKNIQPLENRIKAAQELPPKVRDFLKEHDDFPTLSPHTRLVGSYAQHTSVGDVKDVDFLVRVDGDPEGNKPEAKKLIQDLKKTLDELPEALGYSGEAVMDDIEIERARRSIHIYFQGEDFHIDVVPCIAPDGFAEMIYVPDRGFNEWIPSHPVGYIQLLRDLDKEHGEKVRPLIKLFKHFRNYQMIYCHPKSYWLGVLVIHHVRMDDGLDMTKSLAELFHDLCDRVYKQYDHLLHVSDEATPNIPDPLLDHNISWNWDRSHFETFMRRLDDGRKWAANALEANDRDEAISWWQKIFGDEYFQADVSKEAAQIASSTWPGKTSVSTIGILKPGMRDERGSTPVPSTTFHGETK